MTDEAVVELHSMHMALHDIEADARAAAADDANRRREWAENPGAKRAEFDRRLAAFRAQQAGEA